MKYREYYLKNIDWNRFNGFFIVLPDQFVLLREMIEVKFIELFGRKVSRDVFSYEQMKHATNVVQSEDEVFICFGTQTDILYGKNQIEIPIFNMTSYAAMMLTAYYVVGLIQESLPPYFEDSIEAYCLRAKEEDRFSIKPWVEA